MIDTHAHLDSEQFVEDIDSVLQRAKENGIERIIIPAIEPEGFDNLINLVEKFEQLNFAIGVHPHSADKYNSEVEDRIIEIAKHPKCVAIGEIGLDYYYKELPSREIQIEAFTRQIDIAKKIEKPIIVHNRDSDDDLIEILTDKQDGSLNAVMHCFPDDIDLLKKALKLNLFVSFTGNITFKRSEHKELLEYIPLDRFMIETDSPYMAPVPYRGKRNESSFVKEVAKKISEVKNMKYEEIVETTTRNAKSFFKLIVLLACFLITTQNTFSQDEYYYEDDDESTVNVAPYAKNIGIGGFIGTNTIVESQKFILDDNKDDKNVSYEGIAAIGGTVTYGGIADYLILQLGYAYSKNEKLLEDFPDNEPNIHQMIELASLWIPNPHNKINVYAAIGPSFIMNSINGVENSQIGLNTGVGFIFNVPISGAGLLTFAAEWRLNFELSSIERQIEEPRDQFQIIESNNFYSIPRLNIVFYPEF